MVHVLLERQNTRAGSPLVERMILVRFDLLQAAMPDVQFLTAGVMASRADGSGGGCENSAGVHYPDALS